jgi:hypothetical protein
MFDAIRIPNCPTQFKAIAENIVMMATKPGYSAPDYNTMTELDKNLMVDYWGEYDGLDCDSDKTVCSLDRYWFVHKATSPELIRRARQWLVEHNYLILKESVAQHAFEAGERFSRSVGGGR